ncbi:endocuticle structural glycoprotein SgAbd-4 [Schistocerca piceifrons]|uniref:endocuticle structural glycoprotein SgAbd-4 n=1 Tax=Schistocerca piceifrons TaxID=274613 RepID=UPI001F5E6B13|nr:endocuticle structural glycoprotein SgAbd-4 [Schistocerca piceifrons]
MKSCILWLCALVTVVVAQAPPDKVIPIISQNEVRNPDGSYQWNYETGNGIKADETGTLKKGSKPDEGDFIVAQGSFSYTGPDGTAYSVQYQADDENGFVPQGAHFPTPPPIPPAIQRALDYLATLPSTPEPRPGRRRR